MTAAARVRVIALGSPMARDDGAALRAGERLLEEGVDAEVVLAGRPGPGLLELLEPEVPTVLLDVVRGPAPGSVVELGLDEVVGASLAGGALSSHGLGVAEAFRLAEALGRTLPPGRFLGLAGAEFGPGEAPEPAVAAGIEELVAAARDAIEALR